MRLILSILLKAALIGSLTFPAHANPQNENQQSALANTLFNGSTNSQNTLPEVRLTEGPQSGLVIETAVYEANQSQDVETIQNELAKAIADAQKNNPNVDISIKIAEEENKALPEEAKAAAESLRQIVPETRFSKETISTQLMDQQRSKFVEFATKHYIVSFALIRWVVNGTVTGISLSMANLPAEVATLNNFVIVGAMVGAFSAGFMYYNDIYLDWLVKKTEAGKNAAKNLVAGAKRTTQFLQKFNASFRLDLGKFPNLVGKGVDKSVYFAKWLTLELAFLTVAKVTEISLGLDFMSLDLVLKTVGTGLLSLWAQGSWEIGIGIQKGQALKVGENETKVRFKSDLAVLVLSGVAVGLAIARMQEVPNTFALMIGMGAAGILNLVRLHYKKAGRAVCRGVFAD